MGKRITGLQPSAAEPPPNPATPLAPPGVESRMIPQMQLQARQPKLHLDLVASLSTHTLLRFKKRDQSQLQVIYGIIRTQ